MNIKKFTRKNFVKWALGLPASRRFSYTDNAKCVFASFLKETGVCKNPQVLPGDYYDGDDSDGLIPFKPWARKVDTKLAYYSQTKRDNGVRDGKELSRKDILAALGLDSKGNPAKKQA